jgi:proteasome-associated ATPase
MTRGTAGNVLLNRILKSNVNLNPREETKLVKQVLDGSPELSPLLVKFYLEKSHQYQAERDEALGELESFSESPWFPARCVTQFDSDPPMALVAIDNGRRAVVALGEEVDRRKLVRGTPVLLNQKMNVVLKVWDGLPLNGEMAVFERMVQDRIVVRTNGETNLLLDRSDALQAEDLQAGDSILFDRSGRLALARIAKSEANDLILEETPDLTFDDVGGLGDLIQQLKDFIDLNFFHPEIVQSHRLRPVKGILLVGPPGVGKTMVAKAVANYCAENIGNAGHCKFMNIPPGSQRHWYYGATESNYRRIFAEARQITKVNDRTRVVLFWDELDNVGRRGNDFGNSIDDRTMTPFLAELDGLQSSDNILVIGATNREDLIDPALRRPKRFGDEVFRLKRPDQEAAASIFSKYLRADLPYFSNGRKVPGEQMADEIIEAAVSQLYAPNSPRAILAELTLRDGSKRQISPQDVVSGAMIENVVRRASNRSCVRALVGRGGLTHEDVLDALDDELDSVAKQLKDVHNLSDWIDLDRDTDVLRVEIRPVDSPARPHRYVR